MKAAVNDTITLDNNPCVHGMSNSNWCALCKQASGDKHSNTVIKAFTTKSPRKKLIKKKIITIEEKTKKSNH